MTARFQSSAAPLVLLCAALSAGAACAAGRSGGETFLLQSAAPGELTVLFRPKAYTEHTMTIDGSEYVRFSSPLSGSTSEEGKPELPVEGFVVAVPPGTHAAVDVLESKYETAGGVSVAPVPSHTFTEEGDAVEAHRPDRGFYESSLAPYPPAVAEVSGTSRLRHVLVARVTVHPLQVLAASRELKKLSHLKLRIRFIPDAPWKGAPAMPAGGADPYFEPLYRGLVLNYDQSRAWRSRSASPAADSSGDWFVPGRTYYRIPVIADGLYHLSYATLLSQGIDMARLNNSSAALYHKGVPVPLVVETSDPLPERWYIEFHGERNRGVNSAFHPYSDTGTYWLTWNDARPARFREDSSSGGASADTLRWFMATSHQEIDKNYFFGVTQDEIQTTDDVPGEGWYWVDFVSGTSRSLTFAPGAVLRGTGTAVEFRARLHGMTICAGGSCLPPSRHSAQFTLNGRVIGTADWTNNTEAFFSTSFPESILASGTNTLQIKSRSWTASDSNISKFYLDWFEVRYPSPLTVAGGVLRFSRPGGNPSQTVLIQGLPADSASVFDIAHARRITLLAAAGGSSFTFSDTAADVSEYVVARKDTGAISPPLEAKQFQDLRSASRGADYILVTHALFREAALTLAKERASAGGLRTAVVDVQDIYDEFNFGDPDPSAIRSFFRRAYEAWAPPAPAYAVLFGDASWDYKRNQTSSVKQNFVPAYGNPPSDNALVSFDPVEDYLPDMLVGRIPVSTPAEADRVVAKIIGYDSPPVSRWDKSFLFITGGDTPAEKSTFNFWSDDLAARYVTPPPVGGDATKVYKTSEAIIDGDNRDRMQRLVAEGLVFINFIGHSGGRVWNVDIGNPSLLENTTGMLPFVSSVSCNAGFFSDPTSNVLAEDFLLADNRGAVGVWAGSSIGYGSIGRILVDKFLSSITSDSIRGLGLLTTVARLYYWSLNQPPAPLVIQTLQLHPLIGDPYSAIAIPRLPDYDLNEGGITVLTDPPTSDSAVTLRVTASNLGLMAGVPMLVSLQDDYTDELGTRRGLSDIVPPFEVPDFGLADTFAVRWNVRGKPGTHGVVARLDPRDSVAEVREDNNSARHDIYIFRNSIRTVKPPPFGAVPDSAPMLEVTTPFGRDTTPLTYTFEIDTVPDLSSPFRITSPGIAPGPVSASWQPGPLPPGSIYYWRSRGSGGAKEGAAAHASFRTGRPAGDSSHAVWRQSAPPQFLTGTLTSVDAVDSGVALVRSDSTAIFARSVGNRFNQTTEFYSIIRVNSVTAIGYWWQNAYSFLACRYNPSDGSTLLTSFDLLKAGSADSMAAFLSSTPPGDILVLSVVLNGRQNVTEAIYSQIEQLGSVSIRSVTAGQSWILISRKGEGTAMAEDYKPAGIGTGQVTLGDNYRSGRGTLLSPPIGPASRWSAVRWDIAAPQAATSAQLSVLGLRQGGGADTLIVLPSGTDHADLSLVDPAVYPMLSLSFACSNTDGASTPLLRSWEVEYLPPPDLALSAWTFRAAADTVEEGKQLPFSLDVYNIGFRASAGGDVSVSLIEDPSVQLRIPLGPVPAGGRVRIDTALVIPGPPGERTLVAMAAPGEGDNDAIQENNTSLLPIQVVRGPDAVQEIKVLFDGVEIRNGDYVSASPVISVELPDREQGADLRSLPVVLDGKLIRPEAPAGENALRKAEFRETLEDGDHALDVYGSEQRRPSNLVARVLFKVSKTPQILMALNYPNPFAGSTMFTFVLTGGTPPDELHIRIFTVAGRRVRDLAVPAGQLRLGFNRVPWDGRDDDGDEIANGNYFFRISMSASGGSASAVQRLSRVR